MNITKYDKQLFRLASYMSTEDKFYTQLWNEEKLEYNKRKLAVLSNKKTVLQSELALNKFMQDRCKAYPKFDKEKTLNDIWKIDDQIADIRSLQTPLVQKKIAEETVMNQKVSA
jgi:hypothetical protein